MSGMSPATIVFPRPPPTCNTLTPEERAKLLRSTAKLGQLLGSTPHVVDEIIDRESRSDLVFMPQFLDNPPSVPTDKPLPIPPVPAKPRKYKRDGAVVGDEIGHWQKIRVQSPDSISSSRSSTSSSRSSIPGPSSSLVSSPETEEGWRVRFTGSRPPLLRLGFGKSDKVPSSPAPPKYDIDISFPDNETAPGPNFTIRNDASIRREKMRRLTKKLGEGVPVDLVFPPSIAEEDGDMRIHSPVSPSSPSSTVSSSSSIESTSSASTTSTLVSSRSDSPIAEGKPRMRHEAHHQPPRRSHFAKDLPDFPCQNRQLTVHYETPEEHGNGSETFEGLKRAIVPSRTKRAPVTRKPVPHIRIP